jgi:hypothetical protein
MKSAHLVLVCLLGLTVGGCATIISGTSQIMTVNANVDGAEVHLVTEAGERLLGTTPLTTRVKRGQEGTLRVRAEGYRLYESALNKKINTVFFVNILSGGVFGSTTDYTSGAMFEYEPSTYMVSLQPVEQSNEERNDWQRREGLRGFVLLNNEACSRREAGAPCRGDRALARWLRRVEDGSRVCRDDGGRARPLALKGRASQYPRRAPWRHRGNQVRTAAVWHVSPGPPGYSG